MPCLHVYKISRQVFDSYLLKLGPDLQDVGLFTNISTQTKQPIFTGDPIATFQL